jgi:hypothetical protein
MPQPLTFDFYNSIIEVPAPDTSLDIQYLINQIRDTEDELNNGLNFTQIAEAAGKFDLGGGVYTAITVKLLDNWRVRFEARSGPTTVQCSIINGNLVGGPGGNPVAPSAFTQVIQQSAASGVIAAPTTSSENTNIKYLMSSLGLNQRAIGNIFYWDPVSGSNTNNGLTPSTAVQTFAQAHSLVTNGANDIIFCIASDPSGVTTTDELLSITKNNVKVRGPGDIFKIVPTLTTSDTITINANNIEISGLSVSTAATGSRNAISVSGNNAFIQDCWVTQVRGHGIDVSNSNSSIITLSVIEHCGLSGTGNGVNLGNNVGQTMISKCIIFDNINGVSITGSTLADNVLENDLIYKHTGYGVSIGSGVLRSTLRSGNTFNKNTSGDTLDLGIDTYIETQAGGASASSIADAVWDEVLSSHSTSGTSGRLLKDAKIKATLASLK